MNIIGWLVHFAVMAWCWPLIHHWWTGDVSQGYDSGVPYGRKRWAVLGSLLLPIVAWFWLVPLGFGYRWRVEDRARADRRAEAMARRNADIAYWREQVAQGDLVSAWNGVELLASWGVPLVEPVRPEDRVPARMILPVEPQPLPGAHAYSPHCSCRNCARARAATEGERTCQPCRLDTHREDGA